MKIKLRRGESIDRLSSLLQRDLGIKIGQARFIKPNVLYLRTNKGEKVLKGYSSSEKATVQATFITLLHHVGFRSLPAIETNRKNNGIICWEDTYWILQEYISPVRPFHFFSLKNRMAGAALLERYHTCSSKLLNNAALVRYLPKYSLYLRLFERYGRFQSYLPFILHYIPINVVEFIIQTSICSLRALERYYSTYKIEKNTIIHGDVASHNFLLTEDGLYLIDYDQISIAPLSIDYLQYASRILPFINWSLTSLRELPQLREQLSKKWFLSVLMFPADILREWMAYFRKYPHDHSLLGKTVQYTLTQFEERKRFVKEIYNMIR